MNLEPTLAEHLRELELSLTRPEIRHSPEKLAWLLADGFVEFGSSGRVFDKQQIIEALQSQARFEVSLNDFRAIALGTDVCLVTYCGTCVFPDSGEVRNSLRSSIWRRNGEKWQVLFHQGTPIPLKL